MEIFKDILLLLVGFVLLVKGAGYFVEGSSSIARKVKIPGVIVGLTIVAMGTSLPELAVSVTAGLNHANEIAISNVVGSNLFNLIVVLGVCAAISPVAVDKSVMKFDMPFMLGMTALLAFFFADFIKPWSGAVETGFAGTLTRANGIFLLICFVGYMALTVRKALAHRKNAISQDKINNNNKKDLEQEDSNEEEIKEQSLLVSIIFILGGVVAIKYGGDFVVNSASDLAIKFGMSETLVGLTIVAAGTSLPELVTSIVAAKKGETGLAIGNVVGSNIFNLLFILGVSSVISPIAVIMDSLVDIIIILIISVVVFIFGKSKNTISRKEGIVMFLIYGIYMGYAIIR